MSVHRKNPVCGQCHNRIDPLGLALENFDGVGRYRTSESGAAIDVAGSFPNGLKFGTFEQFRTALLTQREEIAQTLTEKLVTYATGRGVEAFDMPAVRAIQREAAAGNYRWSSLILAIVKSTPFQMRRAES